MELRETTVGISAMIEALNTSYTETRTDIKLYLFMSTANDIRTYCASFRSIRF